MTPVEAIASLDAQLGEHGQSATLKRYTVTNGERQPSPLQVNVRAFKRPVRENEVIGKIDASWSAIVLSPTDAASFLPIRAGDKIVISGRELAIEYPKPIEVADVLVRINLMVAG